MEIAEYLKTKPFMQSLMRLASGVYLVGGIVRDHHLGLKSKDIDLLLCGISIEDIIHTLKPYGYVDHVGESFGIIKFKPHDVILDEAIDIAIPRKDIPLTHRLGGHKDFDVVADPYMPLEEDLLRRDATINSIAYNIDTCEYVDPYGGILDIKRGILRATSSKTFLDDPLRLIRMVQFAARLGFEIEAATFKTIQEHAYLIKTITAERIVTELDKIFYKGDRLKGLEILIESGLYQQIFEQEYRCDFGFQKVLQLKHLTRADFYFMLMQPMATPDVFFAKKLKGDVITTKQIAALMILRHGAKDAITHFQQRFLILEMIKKSELVLDSLILQSLFFTQAFEFKTGKMPCSEKDLAITGDMMIEQYGYVQGKILGDKRKEMLAAVITEKCENTITGLVGIVIKR
jgi:tRNA nucleotidyltransferase/poly(A) polymerase